MDAMDWGLIEDGAVGRQLAVALTGLAETRGLPPSVVLHAAERGDLASIVALEPLSGRGSREHARRLLRDIEHRAISA